jgi:hypothetical protein
MKKPASLNEFIQLVNGMNHRERYVFTAHSYLEKKYEQKNLSIEIYHTILFETKLQDRNITVHLVDFEGTPINKKARLLRLWNGEFYKLVYNMLAGESISEALPENTEILELSE